MDGQIDEFAIYAGALTPDRIAAHYQAALAAITPVSLVMTTEGGALRIEWPGSGWVLQHNNDLSNSSSWSNVPGGDTSPVIINPNNTKDFFRLQHP